jgi:hypothetical protein
MKWYLIVLLCMGSFLTGCAGDVSLVKFSRGTWSQEEKPWALERESRLPCNPKEEQIVLAAEKCQTLKTPQYTYGYLGLVDDDKIVVVFEENKFTPDQFAPKPVERYLVQRGRIRGVLTTVEAVPDVEFEKAVYSAARNAQNPSRFAVTLVRSWRKPLTMKASFIGNCSVQVDVIEGFEPYGPLLCNKLVNYCYKETQ